MGPGIAISAVTALIGVATTAVAQFLAQDTMPTDTLTALQQYGPIGIVAALMGFAVWVLYKRLAAAQEAEVKRLTDEIGRERARADRLEAELKARNTDIQEKYIMSLEQARSVINEAVIVMRTKQ